MKNKHIILFIIGLVIILTGCSLMSTPTSAVESLLTKYKTNDEEIVVELDDYINDSELTVEQSKKYKDIYLKQFKDLKYVIKNETIDGDTATVTAQITVYDYYKAEKESNDYLNNNIDEFKVDGEYDKSSFTDYKLKKYSEVNDTVDYTIDFTLTKIDNMWVVNDLTKEQLEKIHGVYAY